MIVTQSEATSLPISERQLPQTLLYLTIFTSGMTTLAVEITASRLLGSVFGTSNIVWANVIGLILLYLTVGYFIGGRIADRRPYASLFFKLLLWGAFLSALIPLIARPVLRTAAQAVVTLEAGVALGSFAAVVLLFAIPVTLLGTASPFAIRLAVRDIASTGRVTGRITAIGTLGSLIGTFLPTLLLVPELGTFGTFLLFAGILYFVAWIGLASVTSLQRATRYLWMPIAVAGIALLALSGPLRPALPGATLLYEGESAYNYIHVQETSDGGRFLYLNEGQGIHSQYHPTEIAFGRTWDFFLAAPYFNTSPRMESLLIIGLAAGTVARQHDAVYPGLPMVGIEIDGEIIRVGQEFFGISPETMPNLRPVVADGRYALKTLNERFSVIGIDAYRPPYIPWHLTTVEYFQELHALLTDDGVVVINVGRTSSDRRLVDALTETMLQVFPTVHAMDVPLAFNTILVATRQPTTPDGLIVNATAIATDPDAPPILQQTLALAVASIVPTGRSDILFTDDRAPLETLVDSLVINFFTLWRY